MFAARVLAARAIRSSTQRVTNGARWMSTTKVGETTEQPESTTDDVGNSAEQTLESNELLLEKDAQIAELTEDLGKMKTNYLRGLADLENYRKRSAVEAQNAKSFGIQKFSKDLLVVADTLEMALKSAPMEEIEAGTNAPAKTMFEGMDGINKMLLKSFSKHNLDQILPEVGDEFDPNQMEAQLQIPVPDAEAGTIAMVMRTGYQLNARVLRAATVGVVQKQ